MRNFTFTVIDDSEVEGNETLFLEMSSNNPRVIVATPTSLVTIVDDDRRKHNMMSIWTLPIKTCIMNLNTLDLLME